tara:strand:+ start:871 stop:1224 length:354 start_codon:yes stop_codon:yes gene_type:complete
MIKQGKCGSYTIFWKDTLISSIPKHRENDFEKYMVDAYKLLMNQMKLGHSLKEIIKICFIQIEMYYQRKTTHKKNISYDDHEMLCSAIIVLIRVGKLERDDVILEMGVKKSKSLKRK